MGRLEAGRPRRSKNRSADALRDVPESRLLCGPRNDVAGFGFGADSLETITPNRELPFSARSTWIHLPERLAASNWTYSGERGVEVA
jgi:hypothetical protein